MALILPDIKLAVGIDLGTANIKAGIFRNGKLEIIPSSDGNLFMLAYLAFADNCRLFGAPAKYHAFRHPTSSVYNVKSFIGRKTTDPELLTELETFTTKVIDKNGQATFQATHPRAEIEVNTVEVLAMLLGQIRRNVEKYLKVFIPDAVITVPAKYSMRQRQVVKDAALIAGFNILRLLSAPSAILLGRGFEATSETDMENILTIDIGVSGLNVGCARIKKGFCKMLATARENNVGGASYILVLFNHCCELLQNRGLDIRRDIGAAYRLRLACEDAIRWLSCVTEYDIDMAAEGILGAGAYKICLTREFIEDLLHESFKPILPLIERVLDDSNMLKGNIHEILITGHSSHTPGHRKAWESYFDGEPKPTLRVASDFELMGASIEAANRSGDASFPHTCLLYDTTFLPLGVETDFFNMDVITPGNAAAPCTKSSEFRWDHRCNFLTTDTIVGDPAQQRGPACIIIYEGEQPHTKGNSSVMRMNITRLLPKRPNFNTLLAVRFDVDKNLDLAVTVKEVLSGHSITKKVESANLGMLKFELEAMSMSMNHYDGVDQTGF